MPSRRRFIRSAAVVGASALAGWRLDPSVVRLAAQACGGLTPVGDLLGTVPLTGDRPFQTPYGEVVGGPGLAARRFTDLSTLEPDRLITPTERVFIRTAAPAALARRSGAWTIATGGLATAPRPLGLDELHRRARDRGPHLIECSGNNDPNNFGLLSVAEWAGVPLADIVSDLQPAGAATAVLVSGLDDETSASAQSMPGAAWVIPLDALDRLGAFLAVRMNGAALPPDHGEPVRLVVPGWYGCTWIKWVQEIRLVGADEPVTSQMIEFARRTHQSGLPERARDYEAPVVDLAATPIRVERRRVDGRVEYRVVGIAWGGSRAPSDLQIRFGSRGAWSPVELCPSPGAPALWSLWSYRWRPDEAGTYSISLRSAAPDVRTRRLDLFFYTRRVRIDAV
jgi:DMSO/TMAO reductase YedYZ molybdopterin-dependent catalytic subunit